MCRVGRALGLSLQEAGELDPLELVTWSEWLAIEEKALDYRAGLLAASMYNSHIPGSKLTAADFFPSLQAPETLKTEKDLERDLMALAKRSRTP